MSLVFLSCSEAAHSPRSFVTRYAAHVTTLLKRLIVSEVDSRARFVAFYPASRSTFERACGALKPLQTPPATRSSQSETQKDA